MLSVYQEIPLHSKIVRKLGGLARSFYWLRYVNRHTGSGRVRFDIHELAADFEVKYDTACRWVSGLEQKKLFHSITRSKSTRKGVADENGLKPGEVIVDLVGRDLTCMRLGLDSFGVVAVVPSTRLRDLRIALFDIVMTSKQASSVYLSRKEASKDENKKRAQKSIVTNAALYVHQVTPKGKRKKRVRKGSEKDSSCSTSQRRGSIFLFTTATHIFLARHARMTGASLRGIGKEIERSERTTKRYSSDIYRKKLNSPKLKKKQQVKEVDRDRWDNLNGIGGITLERPGRFEREGKVYQCGCNLYDLVEAPYEAGKPLPVQQVRIKPSRYARHLFKRKAAKDLARLKREDQEKLEKAWNNPHLLPEMV